MQSASYTPLKDGVSWRHLRFFLIVPIISLVIFLLATTTLFVTYQRQHQDRIYTGVTVMAVDLSRMTRGEAAQALTDAFPYPNETAILLKDPQTGQSWQKTPAELGFSLDTDRTISEALKIGRDGNPINRLRDVIFSWYYGRVQSPVFLLDEGNQESALSELAAQIDQPAIDAQLAYEGETAVYIPAENGRQLNIENTRTRLQKPLTDFRSAEIEL
ncbi:MAG: peptidoglycan binding domain-containing protein, partial [Caldilineaceae bacterium]